jgi:RNA recognition motif-containing protein
MGKKLFVGNLGHDVTDGMLAEWFGEYGPVRSAQVIVDRDTGRSKGFGFVEMENDAAAQAAVAAYHGAEFEGRTLTVNEARPRREGGGRDRRGGGGSGRRRE